MGRYVESLGEDLEITIGEIRPYAGAVPECSGITVPVNDGLFVNYGLVQVTQGGDDGITLTHETRISLPFTIKYVMCWLVERADIKLDGGDTIARILADLRDPSSASGPDDVAPPGPEQPSARATAIAVAIVAIEDRAAYPSQISQITDVPAGFDLTLPLYQELLRDFFTYDSENEYYAKWPGSGELGFEVVNSAVKVISVDGAPPRDHFDFSFFTVP